MSAPRKFESEDVDKLLFAHCDKLSEFFDNVVVLVSWRDGASSAFSSAGIGNRFAMRGLAQAYLEQMAAETVANCLMYRLQPKVATESEGSDEEGEEWKKGRETAK
jgi:hypothetical protein